MENVDGRNPAFPAIIDSMESPKFQSHLLDADASHTTNAENFLSSRLSRLTASEQAQIGIFIVDGLSFGTHWWDRGTQRTTVQVFSKLDLHDMNNSDRPILQNAYLRAINRQNEIHESERSVDELLTIGRTPGLQLFEASNNNNIRTQIITAWYEVIANTSDDNSRLDIGEGLENIQRKKQIGREKAEITVRRALVLSLRNLGKTSIEISQVLGVPSITVSNDIRNMRASGIKIEIRNPGVHYRRGSAEVTERRERVSELLAEGKNPTEIGQILNVPSITVNNDIRKMRTSGVIIKGMSSGRKKDPEVTVRRERISELLREGKNPTEIGQILNVPSITVKRDIDALIKNDHARTSGTVIVDFSKDQSS